MCRFRQEQEAILRKKEEERREQLAEKAKTRESYREKMSNVMRIDVSSIDYVFFFVAILLHKVHLNKFFKFQDLKPINGKKYALSERFC